MLNSSTYIHISIYIISFHKLINNQPQETYIYVCVCTYASIGYRSPLTDITPVSQVLLEKSLPTCSFTNEVKQRHIYVDEFSNLIMPNINNIASCFYIYILVCIIIHTYQSYIYLQRIKHAPFICSIYILRPNYSNLFKHYSSHNFL